MPVNPQICRSLALSFMTSPTVGHPKERWHSLIEPLLTSAVTEFVTRLETTFTLFDKSRSGYVPKSSVKALCDGSDVDFGPDLMTFLALDAVSDGAQYI